MASLIVKVQSYRCAGLLLESEVSWTAIRACSGRQSGHVQDHTLCLYPPCQDRILFLCACHHPPGTALHRRRTGFSAPDPVPRGAPPAGFSRPAVLVRSTHDGRQVSAEKLSIESPYHCFSDRARGRSQTLSGHMSSQCYAGGRWAIRANWLVRHVASHKIQTQDPDVQRLMMSGKDGSGQILKACMTVVTLVALTGRFRVITAALDDLCGRARGACDAVWPAQCTDGLITLDIIDEVSFRSACLTLVRSRESVPRRGTAERLVFIYI